MKIWDSTTVATVVVALAAPILFALDAPQVLRAPVILLLVGAVPGLALVRLGVAVDPLTAAVLAVAVSLALDSVVALTLLYLESWSILLSLILLAGVALVATSVRLAVPRPA